MCTNSDLSVYFSVVFLVSSGANFFIIYRRVSCRLIVIDPSCCLSVVMCAVRFVFLAAILCIAFHGLVAEVILQNSFQDLLFFSSDGGGILCLRY